MLNLDKVEASRFIYFQPNFWSGSKDSNEMLSIYCKKKKKIECTPFQGVKSLVLPTYDVKKPILTSVSHRGSARKFPIKIVRAIDDRKAKEHDESFLDPLKLSAKRLEHWS